MLCPNRISSEFRYLAMKRFSAITYLVDRYLYLVSEINYSVTIVFSRKDLAVHKNLTLAYGCCNFNKMTLFMPITLSVFYLPTKNCKHHADRNTALTYLSY